ncbi:MAG: hypothetical protein ACO3ZD_07915 [Cyanobium sp.]
MRAFPLTLLGISAVLGATMARAELPPWVYGEQQRQAPVVLRMAVEEDVQHAGDLHLQARVLQVIRQPKTGHIGTGQRIWLVYAVPGPRQLPMVGPAPLPLLSAGDKTTAWLQPIPGTKATFAPAAGGRSFGPSMEDIQDPGAP